MADRRSSNSRSRSPVDCRRDGRHFSDRPRSPRVRGSRSPIVAGDRHRRPSSGSSMRRSSEDLVSAALGILRAAFSSGNSVSFYSRLWLRLFDSIIYLYF